MKKSFLYLLFSGLVVLVGNSPAQILLNTTPTRAIGQLNLQSGNANLVEGREFNNPLGIALDTTTNPPGLYIADTFNNRVLGFRNATAFANGQHADIVIGQVDFLATGQQGPGVSGGRSTGVTLPSGLAVDLKGNLYILDTGNNRVLRFPAPFSQPSQTTQFPDFVIGQSSFNTNGANTGGASEKTLNFYIGTAPATAYLNFDSTGNLWIADVGNNRVLRYPASVLGANAVSGPAADIAIGQVDFLGTAISPSYNATFLGGVQAPTGIAFDNDGRLYVSESNSAAHNRILIYNPPFATGIAAARLLGVVPSSVAPQPPSISEQQLGNSSGGLLILNNGVTAPDPANNRILVFPPVANFNVNNTYTQQAVGVIGQTNFSVGAANQGQAETAADRLAGPQMAAATDSEVYVVDSGNNRVVVIPYSGNTFSPATRLLGQDQFYLNAPNLVEGREFRFTSVSSLGSTAGVVADYKANPPHLYVADSYNNRILGFNDLRTVTFGSKADIVIGQPDFQRTGRNYPTNNAFTPTASSLNQPIGLALDAAGNLYVADTGNSRVLRFATPFVNPQTLPQANLVLGQRSFTGPPITDASNATMAGPIGLAFTGTNSGSENGLLVSDVFHNRVLFFQGSSASLTSGMAATKVFGQSNFTNSAGSSSGANRFLNPRGISSDVDDRLYVADTGNNRIAIFDRASTAGADPLPGLILSSTPAAAIAAPSGVFVNPTTSDIWVASYGNSAILRFPRVNQIPLLGGTPNFVIQDGAAPLALTQDSFGDLYTVDTANRVTINFPGLTILNAASFTPNRALAPGTIGSLFGFPNQFTTQAQAVSSVPLPTTVQNVQVLVNGTPSPLYYLGPNQINFEVPMSAPTSGSADILVQRTDTGQILGNFPSLMDVASPGLFTSAGSGQGQVAAINQDGTINGPDHPAPNGSYVSLYGTGQGFLTGAPPDGSPATGAVATPFLPSVVIGTNLTNNPVPDSYVQYSGLAPGLVGVWQVNVKIPDEVAPTAMVPNTPIVLVVNSIQSNKATIWVKSPGTTK